MSSRPVRATWSDRQTDRQTEKNKTEGISFTVLDKDQAMVTPFVAAQEKKRPATFVFCQKVLGEQLSYSRHSGPGPYEVRERALVCVAVQEENEEETLLESKLTIRATLRLPSRTLTEAV